MNTVNWKKVIPVVAAVVLCFTVIYVANRQTSREEIKDDVEEKDDEKNTERMSNYDSKDDKESYLMQQIDALKEELAKAQKQKIQQQDSSIFHINDKIEINYNGEWREGVVGEILEAISMSIDGIYGEKQIIIDDKKHILCDCYDICQIGKHNKSQHRVRFDNKQSKWAKSIKHFLREKNTANKILKQELNVYVIFCKYWNKIKTHNININDFISYHTDKYNEFMMNIASFIKKEKIKRNTKASNYILDHFFVDKQINMNIIYFWRIHMMHPFLYRDDCMKHFGFILSPTFHEYITNIHIDEKEQKLQDIVDTKCIFTNFDFAKSLKKNLVFMENVLEITNTGTSFVKNDFKNDIVDYQNFLYFASYFRNNNKKHNIDLNLCPLIMRDFVWHSHQLFPDKYWEECILYTDGKIVLDHRDLVPQDQMKQYMIFSKEFWHFIEKYKNELRANMDGVKQHIAKMIVDTESVNQKNSLLVFGYLRRIDENVKYPPEIGDYVLKFYVDKVNWNNDKINHKFINPTARPQNCSGCCM